MINKKMFSLLLTTCCIAFIFSMPVQAENNKQNLINSFMKKIESNEENVATSNKLYKSSDITIEEASVPSGKIDISKGLAIAGTVKSEVSLTKVTFKITDKYESKNFASYTAKPGAKNYVIPKDIVGKLKLNDLGLGAYKLAVIAENSAGKKVVLVDSIFSIVGVKSDLKSNVKLSDTNIAEGNGSFVSGIITSNYKINSVKVEIVNTPYSITVTPNKKSYTIAKEVDAAMRFDKLKSGKYVLKITAKDASGTTVTQKINVTVEECDYKKISYDIVGVKQRTRSDCAFASMATCELYFSRIGKGAFGSLLAKSSDPYKAFYAKNGYSTYGYWSRIGYQKIYSNSLTKLYNGLKKGPVIVHKSMGGGGSHYSVVYGYKGSNDKLYSKYFQVYEVTNGARMDLHTWLTSYSSYNINGPGRFDHMCIKK